MCLKARGGGGCLRQFCNKARTLCGFHHYGGENLFCFLFFDPIIVGLSLDFRRTQQVIQSS